MVSDRNASVRDDDAASPSSSFWQEARNNGNANRMTGRNFIRVEQKLSPPIAILIAFTALYIVLIIRFNIFSFSYAKLVILLLRSKKKAGKSGNMMIFFQNQENAGERGSIAALRELSQPDQERQSIFLENKVNDFST